MARSATTKRLRRRAPAWDEPLVPIDGQHLKALIEASEWTIPALAAEMRHRGKAGASRQTIDYICRGRNKKCRAPLRKELARELNVPEKWLSGELERLPFTTPRLAWVVKKIKPSSQPSITLGQSVEVGSKISIICHPDDLMYPPAHQIAEHRFMSACHEALKRDVASSPPDAADASWNLNRLSLLIEPSHWRVLLDRYEHPERDRQAEAIIAFARAFRLILDPWFEGRAKLNNKILDALGALQDQLNAELVKQIMEAERPKPKRGARKKPR